VGPELRLSVVADDELFDSIRVNGIDERACFGAGAGDPIKVAEEPAQL